MYGIRGVFTFFATISVAHVGRKFLYGASLEDMEAVQYSGYIFFKLMRNISASIFDQILFRLGRSLRLTENENENEPFTADWLFTFHEIRFDRPEPYGFHRNENTLDVILKPRRSKIQQNFSSCIPARNCIETCISNSNLN